MYFIHIYNYNILYTTYICIYVNKDTYIRNSGLPRRHPEWPVIHHAVLVAIWHL